MKGSTNEDDDLNKVETELTHSIKKLDVVIPVEQIVKKVEIEEAKEAAEADKPRIIVVKPAPSTPAEPIIKEPTAAEIREQQMKEIHKTAWETYQMEKFGNTRKTP